MKFIKIYPLLLILGCPWSMMVHADDAVTLPTLHVLAEPELCTETGIVPYQNDEKISVLTASSYSVIHVKHKTL